MTDRTTGPDNPKAQLKGGLDLKALAEAASHQLAVKPDLSPEVAAKVETAQTLAERAKVGAPEAPQKESNFIAGINSALSPRPTLAEPSLSVPGLPAAEGATLSLESFVREWAEANLSAEQMPSVDQVHPASWARTRIPDLIARLQEAGFLRSLPTGQDASQGLNPPSSADTEIGD